MQKKREYERLSKLFSGIDVLTINAAGRTPQRQPESEPPASENPRGEPPPKPENDSLEVETNLLIAVQLDGQSSDEVRLQENDQIESTHANESTDAVAELTFPVPEISRAIPSSLATPGNTIVQDPMEKPLAGHLQTADSNSRGWQKLGIGMLTGIIVTGIILACLSRVHIFNDLGGLVLLIWEVLCGILGAFFARPSAGNSKKTMRDIWVGAVQWSLVPVWIGLVIISLIYLLMFTSILGV